MKIANYYYNMRLVIILLLLAGAFAAIILISSWGSPDTQATSGETAAAVTEPAATSNTLDDLKLTDNDKIYRNDVEDSVVTMYLTVQKGNTAENTNHLWSEINAYSVIDYEEMGVDRYQVAAILQVGDENGPLEGELGYGVKIPNATVQIRGQTSSVASQKSYKIKLRDDKGSWNNQTTICLNKHFYDGVRVRNKLSYDIMKMIPDMISARTQFVHLYVRDETVSGSGEFVDYGLYTQVEQINKTYLENHGMDKNGHLYKINLFEFRLYEEIKLVNDAEYEEAAFEARIETKGDNDHSKLITMLQDVNDETIPITETFEKWFDEDNFFTWMAYHILMGNIDTQSRNLYLYSPLNSNTWYFISWDNDGSLTQEENLIKGTGDKSSYDKGLANYWGNVLFQRVLKNSAYRELINEKIETLRKTVTPELVAEKLAAYSAVTKPYLYSMPDVANAQLTEEQYETVIAAMPGELEKNYQIYLNNLNEPMPFFIYPPYQDGEKWVYEWEASFDFNGEDLVYHFQLARDYLMDDIIYQEEGLRINMIELEKLEPGQYFIRVCAINESLKEQVSFDSYRAEDGTYYFVKCFYVLADGTIMQDE